MKAFTGKLLNGQLRVKRLGFLHSKQVTTSVAALSTPLLAVFPTRIFEDDFPRDVARPVRVW